MSARRALVDCAVLSLQDSCVFYPCCKSCFSRIDTEQLDGAARCRCSRCGSRCPRDQVDYRYRLSLRVTRDSCIFGVTVFGNSLNAFFGIHASGLQKLVENLEGPIEQSTRSRLMMKAVKDCFIGRHFLFGIKLTGTSGSWFGDPGPNGSSSRETTQFVASQMILPKAVGLGGCTVLSYYQILLQKASEYEEGSADPAAPLLLVPATSSSFSNASLCASGLLCQSQLSSLTPTPLWEQSLGVVTSSAEQEEEEEGCSTQDRGEDDSKQTEKSTTSHPELDKHKVTEERTSPLPSEKSFYSTPSFTGYPNLCLGPIVGNRLRLNTTFSPFQAVHKSYSLTQKEVSISQHTRSISSSSSAWEDLPLSESLTEFLDKCNKDCEVLSEIKYEKQTARTNLEIPKPAVGLTFACQKTTQIRTSHSSILSDISNTPAHNRPEDKNNYPHECNPEDEEAFLSFKEEEQLAEDSYNYSADLFSNSRHAESTEAESVRSTTSTSPLFSKTEQQSPSDENVMQLTPHQQKPQISRCNKRDSLNSHGTEYFDFVPPSQSTPIVKLSVVTQPRNTSHTNVTDEASEEMLMWSRRPNRCSNASVLGRKCKHKNWLQVGRDAQRHTLNHESTRTGNHEHDSRVSHATVCDFEEDEEIVAPTPVGKTQQRVASKRRQETENGSSDLGLIRRACQRNGAGYKRLFLDQTPTSSHTCEAQTVNYESETADAESQDGSTQNVLDDANQSCDWSRDLFSDSVAE
ncbi:uncharacterized protein ddias [Kryptolebias marmoratus]|uniref:DNA damage induced apoptosis suppressor n=1 Tax=Kryptolebias marmoratus TaxID=37003 RepID=A0A3Q3B6W0_KRYMA|nr:uncharacterized protein ddias [Kryptolebias marmoratus]